MPSATVIVQEACGLGIGRRLPSRAGIATSTRHCRQAPTGSSSGWSQNRGISMPTCSAARMTSVPLGTVTSDAVDGQRDQVRRARRPASRPESSCGHQAVTVSLRLANSVEAAGSNGQPPSVEVREVLVAEVLDAEL